MASNVIWIDTNIDNQENSAYVKSLESINSLNLKTFKNIDEAINYMENISYEETKVIISGRLYPEFVEKFKENILKMRIIPIVIVFTGKKSKFLEDEKDYENIDNNFYNYGGIVTSFNELKQLLMNGFIHKMNNKFDNNQFIFECIDSKEKLKLPLFFRSLLDNISLDNIELYSNYLYNTYAKEKGNTKHLLDQIKSIPNIPIQILAKYYARFYTSESSFSRDINNDLKSNNEIHLPFIKTLYEGVKLKTLPLAVDNILYKSLNISNTEINKLKDFLKETIEGITNPIIFSKSFLTFSKDKNISDKFLNQSNINKDLTAVLFLLEINNKIDYSLSTHCDLEKESCYPEEKPVLFFPFSFFEIKSLKEIKIGEGKGYEIRLLYLGKCLKD